MTITLATIGYEHATVQSLVAALQDADISIVVDVRALANSRRPGFAKTKLAAALHEAGIGYLHLRGLGTPAEGRAAARGGQFAELYRIVREHLETPEARTDLDALVSLVRTGRRVCLLCLEADPAHCHRTLVAEAVAADVPVTILPLAPDGDARE